ncbi:N-benzyl-3-pyrrolidinol dehydrogenase [Aaosphaeria arxii CBS 175.79]|uniref:N-benzyl-3-pyrrolidinol dehydrogenase n=1 Tax=Aaosphaeria arxii CBS 175.79 TaxID=1450172 RepID=A0A6A5XJE6_9PLEO|nr:N-benzyl-3-pyrrolidinol dehydrogenase [Aaosphaeria arxii CBS 175.79]KAF2012444.1 N-benzyl-3-pyrrolidinol dehydrogenase [Aaosphaeria arxii CBS 175.79]
MTEIIPKSMQAWRKHRGKMEPIWETIPVPSCPPNGALIKLLSSGVCRSDHNLLTNEVQPHWFKDSFTLGHEGCGRIIELGSDIPASPYAGKFAIGDVVALLAVPGCGSQDVNECPECARDLPQLCERAHHSGIGEDGFYAPYAAISVRGLVKVPTGVTPSQAAVATDAVTTAYHAIHRRGQVKKGEVVFLFGLGGLGFNALQILRAIGARVLVSDVKQENLDDAMEIGVDKADVVPTRKDVRDWVRENGWEGKIDVIADFVGMKQTFSDAQHIVRRAGRMLCVGTLSHDNTVHMKVGIRKRLSIIFSYGGQVRDLEEALGLIAEGVLNPMVEDGKIKDFPSVLKDLEGGKIKGRISLLHD